jgi:Tannase and feruloyl esterase
MLIRVLLTFAVASSAFAQPQKCADLQNLRIPGLSLTIDKVTHVETPPMQPYCRLDATIDPRTGTSGKKYGIGFALALPDNWNGRFLFQGGGGLNGNVAAPMGGSAAGGNPGLARGFAVVTTDTGHKGSGFDGSFFEDQQASLDFFYVGVGRVAALAKDIVARYYGRSADHSYFAGCSTGGREAMLMSQRYPTYFDGIVSGDPAIRTGHSNLALAWAEVAFNQVAPKDANGKPVASQLFSQSDRKLVVSSILKACDAKDGVEDGLIFSPRGCGFDPAALTCSGAKTDSCITAQQAAGLKKAFVGPKDSVGNQVYPGFPYDAGIADMMGIPGLLNGARSPVAQPSAAIEMDAGQVARRIEGDSMARIGDTTVTNLTTFAGHNGKLIFYHGMSDPWFSPMDTLGYYEKMAAENGGLDKVSSWSRLYLVPGMGHCQGGSATLDRFDMLTAIVDWVEKGVAPDSVVATGNSLPGKSRPLCAFPKYAQYTGQGDPNDAKSFTCK